MVILNSLVMRVRCLIFIYIAQWDAFILMRGQIFKIQVCLVMLTGDPYLKASARQIYLNV